jgi:hypothetical protein
MFVSHHPHLSLKILKILEIFYSLQNIEVELILMLSTMNSYSLSLYPFSNLFLKYNSMFQKIKHELFYLLSLFCIFNFEYFYYLCITF